MCFENLPIEFDEKGNATLKAGIRNPYEYQTRTVEERDAKLREIASKNGQLADVDFDPVTRVAGALAFHSTVDLKQGQVLEANAMATLFRGYEVILRGRDPRDAAFISSRASRPARLCVRSPIVRPRCLPATMKWRRASASRPTGPV